MFKSMLLSALVAGAVPAGATEPAQVTSQPIKPLVGPTAAIAVPLVPGKPLGLAIGVQTIVPYKSWRFAVELFGATPMTAFTPALGGDVGAGLVDRNGVGGVLAVYARHTFAGKAVTASTQVGPGLVLVIKATPTVVFAAPFVVWIDPATHAITPTLSVKGVFGAPYGATKKP